MEVIISVTTKAGFQNQAIFLKNKNLLEHI